MNDPLNQSATAPEPAKPKPRFSTFTLMVSAMAAGIGCGLFFGEYCDLLSVIGDAYVGLLQMTVLPYIIFSVIGNIGQLSRTESRRLAVIGALAMAVLWGIGLATVWLMPLALPAWKAGSFFSTSLIDSGGGVDVLKLFIPSNPFYSMANNYAPAVVIFCMFFGVALISVKEKSTMLGLLDTINETLSRVNAYIVRISPIGIFAISASASGTMTIGEFGRLQAYLFLYAGSVFLLTLWVLPMLVAAFTPIRYRDLLGASRNVMVTAFVIGSVFVVIPMLVESIRELMKKYPYTGLKSRAGQHAALPEFIIPLAYPFPHLGKIVTLIFVPFAAWFYGQSMALGDYPLFLTLGLFLSFGKVTTTIPFLLEIQQLPADIFQLFLMSSVVAGRLNDLLGAAHLVAFTVLTTCAMTGQIKVKRIHLLWGGVLTVVAGGLMIGTMQYVLNTNFKESFSRDKLLAQMHLLQKQAPSKILSYGEPNPIPLEDGLGRVERIEQTKILRIGFHPDNLPFSYYNARDELVGLDVDLAHRLARDTGMEIEFVPFAFPTLREQLANDHFDIAMSGIGATVWMPEYAKPSKPYMNVTMALAVRDHDKTRFSDIDQFRYRKSVKLGVKIGSAFSDKIRELLPEAKIVELWSESQFFEGPPEYMDALVTSAEVGSAWTLAHPGYTVVYPFGRRIKLPMVFLVAKGNEEGQDFIGHWIELKKQDGTIRKLYDYWILGRGTEAKQPRWSVAKDLLHWID